MIFRNDIQILRGISVLYVVLFHLGFSFLKNGFLGVDVFFVISGFLMAVLYDPSDKKNFFMRRAKRLLPPYFVVIMVTLILSMVINTPNESNQVSEQSLWGSLFLSNIGFWIQNSYFSKIEFNPLLHLWSLGVEIQFYLVIPLIAWIYKKNRFSLLFFISCSIVLCFWILTVSPKTSFFMMPLRAWEFLLGYGAAICLTKNGNIRSEFIQYNWIGVLGIILILLIPILNVDGQSLNVIEGHPGLMALLIVLATLCVLIFGLPKIIEENIVSNLLYILGKYSYSIYLVHFPIIVLYLAEPFEGTILTQSSKTEFANLLVLIFIASVILYRYVETNLFNLNLLRIPLVLIVLTFSLAMTSKSINNFFVSEPEKKIFNAFSDRSNYRCGKLIRILDPSAIICSLSEELNSSKDKILLVGNSHADSIKTTFTNIANKYNKEVYFIVKNNPLMAGGIPPKMLVAEAKLKNINHIVLHFNSLSAADIDYHQLVNLSEMNNIRVTFIEPVPVWDFHVPQMMYRQLHGKEKEQIKTNDEYYADNTKLFNKLNLITNSNFKRISVVDSLCSPNCIYKDNDGTPLYFDNNHLTLTGSHFLKKELEAAVQ